MQGKTEKEKSVKNPLDDTTGFDMAKEANTSATSAIGKKLYSAHQKTFFTPTSTSQQDMTNLANMIAGVSPTYGVRMKNQALK